MFDADNERGMLDPWTDADSSEIEVLDGPGHAAKREESDRP